MAAVPFGDALDASPAAMNFRAKIGGNTQGVLETFAAAASTPSLVQRRSTPIRVPRKLPFKFVR